MKKQKSYPAREFKTKKFIDAGIKKSFNNEWQAWFRIDNQAFTLTETDSKSGALFHKRMVLIALEKIKTKYSSAKRKS